jgi:cytochrome P450
MTTLAELDEDPHPEYTRLRAEEPVSWLPAAGQWLVTGWRDVLAVLSDPVRFRCEHTGIHEVFRTAYEPGLTRGEVDTIARPVARKVADDLFAAGGTDLTAEYFEPVAAVAGATLLGLGVGCAETLLRWGTTIARDTNAGVETDAGEDAAVIVDRLRRRPDDSLVARLVHADANPVPLLRHLALSVLQPGWLAAWTLSALWSDPGQLAAVAERRRLLGPAVYEALRWGGPVGALTRLATRAVTLGGKAIPAGASLAVAVASANRDEAEFPAPHRFDVRRVPRAHLGFGVGPRHCPAHPVVMALARTALDELFDRMPDLAPAPGWRPAPHGWRIRMPGPLDAVWTCRRTFLTNRSRYG